MAVNITDDGKIKDVFLKFSRVGVPNATSMNGKNFSKICRDSGILDGKKVTSMDVDIEFSKRVSKGAKMCFKDFREVILVLGKKKGIEPEAVFARLRNCEPGMRGVTKTSKTGNVDHLTEPSQYTGLLKDRLETANIKGCADRVEPTGYVVNYKNPGPFDRRSSGGSSASTKATEVTARLIDTRKFTGTQKFKQDSQKDGKSVPAHKLLAYLYKSTKSSDGTH